jgi:hypothetical protein
VEKLIKECDSCQRAKSSTKKAIAYLRTLAPTRPLEIVTMNIIGPLPTSQNKNKYILAMCDHFSKWTAAFPLKDQTAAKVAVRLVEFIASHGIPEQILTDQGTNFQSELMAELYELMDIRRIRTSPFDPQTDGITERFNQTLKRMLASFVNKKQDNWDGLLLMLTFAYNSATHRAMGHTPFEVLYGRKPRIPLDLMIDSLKDEPANATRTTTSDLIQLTDRWVVDLEFNLKEIFERVKKSRDVAMAKAKIYYDRKARPGEYKVGELVLVDLKQVKKGQSKKLANRWQGSFIVIERINDVNYRVKHETKEREYKWYMLTE